MSRAPHRLVQRVGQEWTHFLGATRKNDTPVVCIALAGESVRRTGSSRVGQEWTHFLAMGDRQRSAIIADGLDRAAVHGFEGLGQLGFGRGLFVDVVVVSVGAEGENIGEYCNLVSMGFGWSVVPKRALAIYGRRKPVIRIDDKILLQKLPDRELVVVVRSGRAKPEYLRDFIEDVLF